MINTKPNKLVQREVNQLSEGIGFDSKYQPQDDQENGLKIQNNCKYRMKNDPETLKGDQNILD